jgi:hypothetical protein
VPLPSGDTMRDDRVGDRFCLDRADDAEEVELAEEPASALALRTTDLLSSRNINDSWSRYPGQSRFARMHWEQAGRT